MCRIVGYLGPPIPLSAVLTSPAHALRMQGKAPRHLPPGMIGSDGYGVAWYSDVSGASARYRSPMPIWNDLNLEGVAAHIESSCLVASTRTATPDMPVSMLNTPPFAADAAMLVHNGSIGEFRTKVMGPLRAALPSERAATICGNTDTEHVAAWLAETPGADLGARVRALLRELGELIRSSGVLAELNLIVANGSELVAVRHAIGQSSPTLFYTVSPPGGVTVASEPLDDDRSWTPFPSEHLLTARPGEPARLSALSA